MNSPCSPRKAKEEHRKKKKRRKIKIKMNEVKLQKKTRKTFVCAPVFEKSILCDLVKTYLLIPLFTN